ncbi:MAG: hypothetical protein K0R75_3113, partial [Paenibacillaceae bacterium]|nr:hypothetical protein [Paenibacillaceae bacterium]
KIKGRVITRGTTLIENAAAPSSSISDIGRSPPHASSFRRLHAGCSGNVIHEIAYASACTQDSPGSSLPQATPQTPDTSTADSLLQGNDSLLLFRLRTFALNENFHHYTTTARYVSSPDSTGISSPVCRNSSIIDSRQDFCFSIAARNCPKAQQPGAYLGELG